MPSFLKEPLLHFLLAAALLLVAWHFFARPEVKVSPQLISGIVKDYEGSLGRPATPEEVKKITDEYVENEILYREALRTGLIQDNRVRGLLIQTMRTSLRPIVPPPTEADLVALRNQTPQIYRYPAKVSFEHVSFADEKSIPEGLLEKLRSGTPPQGLGDPAVRLANPLPPTFRTQLDHLFGAAFTDTLIKCEKGVWSGLFPSNRGVHFVKVLSSEPEQDMPMAELRPTLTGKWTGLKEAEIISQKVEEMKKSYRVVLPPANPAKP
ncbi:peptidyl-prolyl cis-trans isomerase [Luteolibacter ambystomatis]|uniref:Peptidyl-prolyl cis-trans isomerase n=1 Tax=Luteolibacter ambystomatis TaxID=2824561 RepID=A0A975IY10_9BACT|nr:peptidylprolyl isomerase [Luteolibacter ambystomatis]QUE49742.1 peptidyl-prolyl cis-trans isomerase [Luteolibacter ambystomatis]